MSNCIFCGISFKTTAKLDKHFDICKLAPQSLKSTPDAWAMLDDKTMSHYKRYQDASVAAKKDASDVLPCVLGDLAALEVVLTQDAAEEPPETDLAVDEEELS